MEIQDDSRRKGEAGRAPFRSGRFFAASGKWFFTTREGKDHGPFASKQEAEMELRMFLRGLGSVDAAHAGVSDPWSEAR